MNGGTLTAPEGRPLDPHGAAKALGRSYDHVLRLIRAGRLEAYDDGAGGVPRYRITPAALERFRSSRATRGRFLGPTGSSAGSAGIGRR